MRRVAWSALLIVLTLRASPTAFAQSFACHAVRHGESATQAAQRVTGSGQNAYQPWFQIVNSSSRFVPKSQYNRIHAGWRVCIIKPVIPSLSPSAHHIQEPEANDAAEAANGYVVPATFASPPALTNADAGNGSRPAASDILRRLGGADLTMLWVCVAMAVPWFGWRVLDDYLARRKTAAFVVQHFVQRFVDEFERPLLRDDTGERPLRSHLRFGLRRGRFDILLAPGDGRRYPNLSDHKKNVEYDVSRVVHLLGDDSFLSGAPYASAGWIVVPFQFTSDPGPSGVTCISSL